MRIQELIPWRSHESGQLSPRQTNDPFTMLQSEVNRLFDTFFDGFEGGGFGPNLLGESAVVPKIDVAESDNAVQVTAELPGLKEEDVEVTLSDGELTIRGEKRADNEQKGKNYYRVERSYGSFHRSVPLPAPVDDTKVDASFQNGVLKVVMPKTAPSAPAGKKIPVRRLN